MSFLWKLPQNALNCGKQDDMISPKHIFYQFQGILPSYNLNYISEIHAFNSLKIMKAGVLDKLKYKLFFHSCKTGGAAYGKKKES